MPRRPKKGKSANLLMRKLVQNLSPIESAILRERILAICEETKGDMELFPEKYERGIIAPRLLMESMNKCINGLLYDDERSAREEAKKRILKEKEVKVIEA
jgi:hypothetical protein